MLLLRTSFQRASRKTYLEERQNKSKNTELNLYKMPLSCPCGSLSWEQTLKALKTCFLSISFLLQVIGSYMKTIFSVPFSVILHYRLLYLFIYFSLCLSDCGQGSAGVFIRVPVFRACVAVWVTAARRSETEQKRALLALRTRPCKVEVSSPFPGLCKYGLLDRTVSAAHTQTHTHTLPFSDPSVVGVTHTQRFHSGRANQPAYQLSS